MRTVGSVVDFTEHAATRAAEVQNARRQHPAGTLTPFTGIIVGAARFIADHRLPEGDITFLRDVGLVVDLSRQPHPTGEVARWANHLDASDRTRTEVGAYIEDSVTGYLPDGTWVRVVGRQAAS